MSRIVLVRFKRGLTSPSLTICSLPIKAFFHFIDLVQRFLNLDSALEKRQESTQYQKTSTKVNIEHVDIVSTVNNNISSIIICIAVLLTRSTLNPFSLDSECTMIMYAHCEKSR